MCTSNRPFLGGPNGPGASLRGTQESAKALQNWTGEHCGLILTMRTRPYPQPQDARGLGLRARAIRRVFGGVLGLTRGVTGREVSREPSNSPNEG